MKLKVEVVTSGGSMPDGFEEAADLYLPTRLVFAEMMAVRFQLESTKAPEGHTWGLLNRTYRTAGHAPATCDIYVAFYVAAKLDPDELEQVLEKLIMKLIEKRLKAVFKRDQQDCRRANHYARRKERKPRAGSAKDDEPTLAPDVDTHEHVLADDDCGPGLRLVS